MQICPKCDAKMIDGVCQVCGLDIYKRERVPVDREDGPDVGVIDQLTHDNGLGKLDKLSPRKWVGG